MLLIIQRITIIVTFLVWLKCISCDGFRVLFPLEIKGIYHHIQASFGPKIDQLPFDGPYQLYLSKPDYGACTPLNDTLIRGNVVLIKRGPSQFGNKIPTPDERCRFVTKVLNAQNAGAIAAIIGNDDGDHTIVPMYAESAQANTKTVNGDISQTNENTNSDQYNLKHVQTNNAVETNANSSNSTQITIPSISVSQHTYTVLFDRLNGSNNTGVKAVWIKLTNEGELQVSASDNALQNWIEAIVSSLVLVGMMMLFISVILSVRLMFARFWEYYEQYQRRRALASIPIIRYQPPSPLAEAESLLSQQKNENQSENENDNGNGNDNSNDKIENNDKPKIHESSHIQLPSDSPVPIDTKSTKSAIATTQPFRNFLLLSPLSYYFRSNSNDSANRPKIHNDTCNVCLDEFETGEKVKMLPCHHGYHNQCIEQWLITHGNCPVCKKSAF